MTKITEITAEMTHPLRQKVLRPHQKISEMRYPLDIERQAFHLGAFIDDQLKGIVSLYPESQEGEIQSLSWRLRGMAVEPELQGQGVGKLLVESSIEFLLVKQAHFIWCNARTTAMGFYQKLGFQIQGEEFEIAGIGPHYVAQLDLQNFSI